MNNFIRGIKRAVRVFQYILVAVTVAVPFSYVSAEDWGMWGLSNQADAAIAALPSEQIVSLPVPVVGVAVEKLTRNFGDPRSGGRAHEGLDIMAPLGTPIASPTDAVVTRTGDGGGSGIYVRTANPGGETFVYMHLSEIAKGVEPGTILKRGDIIGFVGFTGNAVASAPHLHLEIRKDGPTDPFSRLTQNFTADERVRGLAQAIQKTNNATLPATIISRSHAFLTDAQNTGIVLPSEVVLLMGTAPVGTEIAAVGALSLGSSGAEVIRLQEFLMRSALGSAGVKLRGAGATGNFGPITQAALIEYQLSANLAPTGIVDTAIQALLFAALPVLPVAQVPQGPIAAPQPIVASPQPIAVSVPSFSRDLKLGSVGDDVRQLQVFLNVKGFLVAQIGTGAPGLESTYFGARTKAALARYQASIGVSPAMGYFGPLTRSRLATL